MKIRTRKKRRRFDPFLLFILPLILGMTLFMAWVICYTPMGMGGLGDEVEKMQHQSGVKSPVTAVLLNFRGYDTLLEVMVLLLATIGVWSLTKAPFNRKAVCFSPVQDGMVRLLAPLMVLVAVYLVWQGGNFAGGAFQGGAVLGGAGVLMLVAEMIEARTITSYPLRMGLALGPLVFLGVALLGIAKGGELLYYPKDWAGPLLLLVELTCAISIGLSLCSLFAGGRPLDDLGEKKPTVVKGGNNQ